jgi:hypothetical protein
MSDDGAAVVVQPIFQVVLFARLITRVNDQILNAHVFQSTKIFVVTNQDSDNELE